MNPPTKLRFFLDANCVNARQRNEHLNALEQLRMLGKIVLMYSDAAHGEAGFNSQLRRMKAAGFSYTMLDPEWGHNQDTYQRIAFILFPSGPASPNEWNDVKAVYHAERLQWPLITMDGSSRTQPGGILGRAVKLAAIGIEVITPAEALRRATHGSDPSPPKSLP